MANVTSLASSTIRFFSFGVLKLKFDSDEDRIAFLVSKCSMNFKPEIEIVLAINFIILGKSKSVFVYATMTQ